MSFRKELKSIISKNKIEKLKYWIMQNDGKILHAERNINSVYLDNKIFSMHVDSIEGSVPRKKIRIRNYNDLPIFDTNNNKLELKISSAEGRYKKVSNIDNIDLFNFKVNDNNYGACFPVVCVSYKRIYYSLKKIRLTIDRNISYRIVKFGKISSFFHPEPYNIIEIKYNNPDYDNTVKSFPFHFVRFSKYSRAIEYKKKKYGF